MHIFLALLAYSNVFNKKTQIFEHTIVRRLVRGQEYHALDLVRRSVQEQNVLILAHKEAFKQSKAKYPKEMASRHDIRLNLVNRSDYVVDCNGEHIEGFLGIAADLLVIDAEHDDVQAIQQALSQAYGSQLRSALFDTDEHMQAYQRHPLKRQIGIRRITCLERLKRNTPAPPVVDAAQGYIGCAADFLR